MDISAMVFLSSISIHLACTVYIVSQGAKVVIWLFKFMKDDDKQMDKCCKCVKCDLQFNKHDSIEVE